MQLLKILLEFYVYAGFVFLGLTIVKAIHVNKTDIFWRGPILVLSCVFTWPRCVYLAIKKKG